ncbi:MAG: lysophospholipid acyltransferase family protein [Pseudomonadota bacterium]
MSDEPPPDHSVSIFGLVLACARFILIILVILAGLLVLVLFRLAEVIFDTGNRRASPKVVTVVSGITLRLMGLGLITRGDPMVGSGGFVANHSSWLDIFVLSAATPVIFVAKAEVSRWPGIGALAQAAGTVFIARDRRQARVQQKLVERQIEAGHRLLFFPEGTSTDGQRVVAFNPTLFAAFFVEGLSNKLSVQPITVRYEAPPGRDKRFYGWWGDMEFGPHFLSVLARPVQGRAIVQFHSPLRVADHTDRKALAARAEDLVRAV